VPVLDDLTPEEAAGEISRRSGIEIGDINGHRLDQTMPPEDAASEIAGEVTRAHVRDAHRRGDPPTVRLVTYDDTAGLKDEAVLNLDWRHRMANGQLESSDEARLRTALLTTTGAIKDAYGACEVTLAVKAHLPIATALGHAFAQPTGCTLRLHRGENTPWISASASGTRLQRDEHPKGPVQSRAAAVEVSISRDSGAGVVAFVRAGNRYRHRFTLTPPDGPGRESVDGPMTANTWARQTAELVVSLADRSDVDRIDLFLAVPVEIAILIGWWANAAGKIDLMNWADKVGPYSRMWSLP
jgi:hypothetical protein